MYARAQKKRRTNNETTNKRAKKKNWFLVESDTHYGISTIAMHYIFETIQLEAGNLWYLLDGTKATVSAHGRQQECDLWIGNCKWAMRWFGFGWGASFYFCLECQSNVNGRKIGMRWNLFKVHWVCVWK